MRIDITQGVQRVLQAAESYRSAASGRFPEGATVVTAVGVLIAMLNESECRAAHWLAERHINHETVAAAIPFVVTGHDEPAEASQTPASLPHGDKLTTASKDAAFYTRKELAAINAHSRLRFYLDGDVIATGWLEPSLGTAIFSAMRQLQSVLPQPVMATEQILFALSLEEGEVGALMQSHGMQPAELLERIALQEGLDLNAGENTVIKNWDESLQAIDESQETGALTVMERSNTAQSYDVNIVNPDNANANHINLAGTNAVFRILDASANRAIEGARVIEDYLRFGLDDKHLMTLAKELRHELATALRELPQREIIISRSTNTDVGTDIEGKNEYHRTSLDDVLKANFSRVQESLRSLEEYGKIVVPNLARIAEQLRYRTYTLQKAIFTTSTGIAKLADAALYVLVDARDSREEFETLVQAVLQGGADLIQLRDKNADDRTLLERAKLLRRLTAIKSALMVVNDRPDIAVLSGADGVHVGQEELSVSETRRIVGADMLIGVSTHDIQQAKQAVLNGADYIGAGPTFSSTTKQFNVFPGISFLKEIVAELRIPAFAIGGINMENITQVLETGIKRIAIASAVTDAAQPNDVCRQLKRRLVQS